MVALISKMLLEKEIEKVSSKENLNDQQEFYLTIAKKELSLLEKLNVECDMRGTEQEVADRLESNALWMLSPEDKERYTKAYDFYVSTKITLKEMEKPGI